MRLWHSLALVAQFFSMPALAGSFIFAGGGNSPDIVTHPGGYDGSGGTVTVNVCIDSASPNADSMVVPVQNIVRTLNSEQAVTPNLKRGTDTNIPANAQDFESVALHEVGHCIGLAHPNLGIQPGVNSASSDYTNADRGANGVFNLQSGLDAIVGSQDDQRGDDVNLHWFRRADNNPFLSLAQPSSSTMSRLGDDLPIGSSFAANADRSVGAALGFVDSEAVMQQGSFPGEDQRVLLADDIDTLKLARTGLDRTANTGDDYNVTLTYGDLQPSGTSACDVTLAFDDSKTGFAVCQTSGAFISTPNAVNKDVRITSAKAYFSTQANWFFNDVPNNNDDSGGGGGDGGGGDGGGGDDGGDSGDAVQPFSFTDEVGVPSSTVRVSNAITVLGPSEPVAIEVTGGSYSIGCTDRFVASTRTISSGETVCVRHTSAEASGGTVSTTLSIGNVSDTFSTNAALQPGEPVNNLSGEWDSRQFFGFNIPEGAVDLSVTIGGGVGDADLYVRYATLPTLDEYDCRPFLNGSNESCSFPEPATGKWFVLINGFDMYSGLTLEVDFNDPFKDTDGDRIRDGLDIEPSVRSNYCSGGEDVNVIDQILIQEGHLQCAADRVRVENISFRTIQTNTPTFDIISSEVRFAPGFKLELGDRLRVFSENPPPGDGIIVRP